MDKLHNSIFEQEEGAEKKKRNGNSFIAIAYAYNDQYLITFLKWLKVFHAYYCLRLKLPSTIEDYECKRTSGCCYCFGARVGNNK